MGAAPPYCRRPAAFNMGDQIHPYERQPLISTDVPRQRAGGGFAASLGFDPGRFFVFLGDSLLTTFGIRDILISSGERDTKREGDQR